MPLSAIVDRLPDWMAMPLSVAALLAAATATGLMLLAAVYGDPVPAYWGGGLFALGGLLWLAADHARDR